MLPVLFAADAAFPAQLAALLDVGQSHAEDVRASVAAMLADVRTRGDTALLEYSARFDRLHAASVAELRIDPARCAAAWQALDDTTRDALQVAHERIAAYAERQKLDNWKMTAADGSWLGQQVTALDRVGLYVPGGKAAYPSSVLMNAIPAKVAGVAEIVMAVPCPDGEVNPLVLAAAHLCGVDEIWMMGGAQAVAALAYGTQSIRAVDKITGPGNQYVAEAKRAVFGTVGIDMIAGPSEVVVWADDHTDPRWIAADLFAQAEHDEMAQSILVTASKALADKVQQTVAEMLPAQPRRAVIEASLRGRGAIIVVEDDDAALAVINHIAPEHLELLLVNAENLYPRVRHAGAIFIGNHSNEVFGDYCAGTNHVLPTSRTARFASPLGVYDFQKRTSLLALTPATAQALAPVAAHLADGEGLSAHALSARLRGEA
ncbi:MAG: histidinol dehydrogenase [Cardiobacteriaceae bacterium]|nr:histidinol dehydrogenase [Cardiobacteriaceae bacterium]